VTNRQFYTNVNPDDGLHSLTYAMLTGELLLRGNFGGHAGSKPTALGAGSAHDLGVGYSGSEDPHDMSIY
jgi:hypothetical protein